MSAPLVIVVSKRTAYRRFVEDERDPHVRELLRRRHPSVARWIDAHREHVRTLARVERALRKLGARVWVLQGPRIAFDPSAADLVVTVGGDGTLLAASHHVVAIPVLGVNSAPKLSVGFFCGADSDNASEMLAEAFHGRLPRVELTRMQVTLGGRVCSRRVLNEALFCHAIPAAASRYVLNYGRRIEEQRSSGFWIGPAAGSTGAQRSAGGQVLALRSKRLQLVTREAYLPGGRPYRMSRVLVENGRVLSAQSKMDEACLFLDGPFQRVPVRLGETVTFSTSQEPLTVLGLDVRRGR